jgi:hypothetical protein
MSDAAYSETDGRLMWGDEELLVGEAVVVTRFAAVLNAADPVEERIAPTLRALFGVVPDSWFAPGGRLLSDGSPMINLISRRVAK